MIFKQGDELLSKVDGESTDTVAEVIVRKTATRDDHVYRLTISGGPFTKGHIEKHWEKIIDGA